MKDIVIEAKKYGLKNIFVSNGFESYEMIKDMEEYIDAINVDLKSFNVSYYKKLGGNLAKVLENLELFSKSKIWLEITTLIVPTKNDTIEEITSMAEFISKKLGENIPWHLSAFHPDYKDLELPRTSMNSLKDAKKIGKDFGLNYIYIGNVGLQNITSCKNCGLELIERDAFGVNKITLENGNCPNCKTKLDGVFDE